MSRKGSTTTPSAPVTTLTEENVVTQPETLSRTSTVPTDGPGTPSPTPTQTPSKAPKIEYADLAAVSAAYQSADTSTKAAMRKLAETSLRAAVTSGDLATAQLVIAAQAAMVAKSQAKVSEPVDHVALIKARARTLLHAAHMILTADVLPEGLPSDLIVPEYMIQTDLAYAIMASVHELGGPDATREDAIKLASQKISANRPAPRKSGGVAGHIEDVRNGLTTSTFLTVAAIAKTHTDTYGADLPSTGAVASRLDAATFQSDGVTPYAKGEKLPDGTTAPAAGAWFEVA